MEQWEKDARAEADRALNAAKAPDTMIGTSSADVVGLVAPGERMNLSVPQEPDPVDRTATPEDLSQVDSSFKAFAPVNPSEFFVPPVDKPDRLLLRYPQKSSQISEARQKGYSDDEINNSMNQWELELMMAKTPKQIDEFFGRTAETKKQYDWQMKNLYAGEMALRLGLGKEDVLNRIDDANALKIDPDLFLRDANLWKRLCEQNGVKNYRFGSVAEAMKTAAQIRVLQNQQSEAIWGSMTDFFSADDSQLIESIKPFQDELRKLQQGKAANFLQDVAYETTDLGVQGVQGVSEGLQYAPLYGAAALKFGGSTLNPVGAAGALAAGVGLAATHGAFQNTLKLESTSEYLTLRSMNVDKRLAAALALGGGVIKAGIELNMFSRLSEYIPGLPKMDKFLSLPQGARDALAKLIKSDGVAPLIQVPTIRNALMKRLQKYGADVGSNSMEEVMQDGVDVITETLAEYLAASGNMPVQEALKKLFSMETAQRLAETGVTSAEKFAKGMLPGAAINAAGASYAAHEIQKTPEAQRAQALNERYVTGKTGEQGDQAVVFLPASVLQEFGQSDAPAQGQIVNQESGSSIAQRLGVDEKATVESTGEVMISREAYEKLAAEDESFAKATESKVRYGAMGRTFDENAAAIRQNEADPLNAPDDPWAKEAREIRDEKAQELKDAGFDSQSAEAMAYVYAKNRFVKAVRLGTDVLGIRKNDARSPKQLSQIELDNRGKESKHVEAASTLYQELAPYSYEARLDSDVKAWEKKLDDFTAGKITGVKKRAPISVMDTPLAFVMAGAKLLPIVTNMKVINKVLNRKHHLSPETLKQVPRAMADPIMIMRSPQDENKGRDSLIALLELRDKDAEGKDRWVIAAVQLNEVKGAYEVNDLSSVFRKDKSGQMNLTPEQDFASYTAKSDSAGTRLLRYINKKKSLKWAKSADTTSMDLALQDSSIFDNIPNEGDLVKARRDKANKFYQSKNSKTRFFSERNSLGEENRGQIAFMSDGTAIVSLFEKADRSTFFHEMGHFMLEELIQYGLDDAATEDMKRDLAVAVDYLGIGFLDLSQRTSLSPAKADRYRKAQEDFARSFEAYLMTGRAPSVEMKGIFGKLRRWLLDIYADMTRLEVKLSPEVRDLFDRLLATPEEIDAARADFATVADLAKENEAAASRLKELDSGRPIPRVLSAMWDSAALDDKDMPAWATSELANGISDAMQLGRPELVKAVKKLGGINYDSLVAVWGKEEAERLRTREKSLFRKKGAKFDTLVSELAHEGVPVEDAQALWNRLMADDPAVEKELNIAIDEESLPWLFYLMSDDEVLRYAKRRGTVLNGELKKLKSADDPAGLRLKGPAIQDELNLIAEIKTELREARVARPSPDSDADNAEFSADMFVREGAVERQSLPTQEAADKAAGVTRDDGGSVSIKEADLAAWERAQRLSKQAYKSGIKDERLKSRAVMREAQKSIRLAYKEGMRVQRDKVAELKAAQRLRAAQKAEINSILKGIKKAAADKRLSWSMKQKISEKLKGYTLKKPSHERLAMAEELKTYLEQTPEAELSNFSVADQRYIKMLETTTLWDMTIADVRRLGIEIGTMQQQGREEYDRWQMERDARREAGWKALMACTGTGTVIDDDNLSTVITAADLKKPYKGVSGRLEKAKDWTYANTLGANRFFDWLGGGYKDYKSAWTQYFVDAVNAALDEELRWRQERFEAMETRMMDLNLSPKRMNEIRHVDGQAYSVDALIHIYAGLKNEKSRKAILFGNMGARFRKQGETAVEAHAAHCVQALTPAERALGDAVIADFSNSFERLNDAYIAAFNEGMTPEENYTPMRRLEYTALDLAGLRADATEAELLEGQAVETGARNAVLQKGFLNDRMNISEENQKPIHLGLLGLWHDQVTAQEHTAAYGKLAGDLRSMLMKRDDSGNTLGKALKLRFGSEALGYLREYTNIAIEGQAVKAASVMDDVSGYLGKNMAVAYLALNLGTVLKQCSSLPRFLITAGPGHIFSALGEFLKGVNPKGTNKLLSKVYALDPQMKNRSSDAFVQVMKDARKYGKGQSAYMDMLELMMEPISYMDKVVSCIGWKATYDSNIKRGLSRVEAVREAQRAVALTQQTPLAKDMPRIWNQKGLARLFMLFTSDAANTWGLSVYDLAHGKGKEKLQTVAALAMTAVMMGYMQGGPDDDDAWIDWYMKQLAAQQVGAVPMAGKEFMSALESLSRGGGDTTYSAISTPFIKLVMGLYNAIGAEDAGKTYSDGSTKRERGLFMALEGASLLTTFPFTLVNRIRRMARSEDAADAARVMFGMRRQLRRARR